MQGTRERLTVLKVSRLDRTVTAIDKKGRTVQYRTVQYSTLQYSTVQYSTVQYSTVQYSTVETGAINMEIYHRLSSSLNICSILYKILFRSYHRFISFFHVLI